MSNVACAVAHANIALAKYWGKASVTENLPATPSLSLTLDGLRTSTRVRFDRALTEDSVTLDGTALSGRPLSRVVAMLDRVREQSGMTLRASVESHNEFPTAAGLASSASGFAALALAASSAAGLKLSLPEASALARASSASAARSLFGGFAALAAGGRAAERVAPGAHFPVTMLVVITQRGEKAVASSDAMQLTAATSPYYAAWVEHAPAWYEETKRAVLERDLRALGQAMEQSAFAMHACMLAARPAILYFSPVTLAVTEAVYALRAAGTPAFFTMDAGPHVKVLTEPARVAAVAKALGEVAGVQRVIECGAGPDAHLVDPDQRFPPKNAE